MACISVCPPDKNAIPGTSDGTLSFRHFTVSLAISSLEIFFSDLDPGSIILGFNITPFKSTLFNSISNNKVDAKNFPFCTIDPNFGIVEVPDSRLDTLSKLVNPESLVPTTIEFADIAGLVKGKIILVIS